MKNILIREMTKMYVVDVDGDGKIIPGTEQHVLDMEETDWLFGPGNSVSWAQGEWPDKPGRGTIVEVGLEDTKVAGQFGLAEISTRELEPE